MTTLLFRGLLTATLSEHILPVVKNMGFGLCGFNSDTTGNYYFHGSKPYGKRNYIFNAYHCISIVSLEHAWYVVVAGYNFVNEYRSMLTVFRIIIVIIETKNLEEMVFLPPYFTLSLNFWYLFLCNSYWHNDSNYCAIDRVQ